MTVERVFNCDGPDCERWHRTLTEVSGSFLSVFDPLEPGEHHFCGWDCLLRYAGRIEPEEVLHAD